MSLGRISRVGKSFVTMERSSVCPVSSLRKASDHAPLSSHIKLPTVPAPYFHSA